MFCTFYVFGLDRVTSVVKCSVPVLPCFGADNTLSKSTFLLFYYLLPNNTCRQSDHAAQSLHDLSSQLCKKVYIINVQREKSAVSQNSSAEPAAFFLLNLKKKKKRKNLLSNAFSIVGILKYSVI